jgi:hypothetical protein
MNSSRDIESDLYLIASKLEKSTGKSILKPDGQPATILQYLNTV